MLNLFFNPQNCQYTASSFPSLWGPNVNFRFLLLEADFEFHSAIRHKAAFLFLWRSSAFIGQVGRYLIRDTGTAFYQCGKAGLSVNLCLGLQTPVFPRLARAAGSFSDPSNSPAERNRAEAGEWGGGGVKICEVDRAKKKMDWDRGAEERGQSGRWLTEGQSVISFQEQASQ